MTDPTSPPPRRRWWKRRVRRVKRRARNAFTMFGARKPADEVAEGPRVAAWERRAEWPLTFLAVLFLAGYTVEVLEHPLPARWRHDIDVTTWVIWVVFGIDFVVRVALARRHMRYVWRHLTDILIIALPILRPLRLLRVVLLVRTLNRRMADSFGGSVIVYGGVVGGLICFCASLAVLQAERDHGGNIHTFGQAMWWSVVTIATVGYGDKYPVTTEGRFIGAALMITGVALFGAVTASFAGWLVDQTRTEEAADQQATRNDLEALRAQLTRMEAQLSALGAATGAPVGPPDSAASAPPDGAQETATAPADATGPSAGPPQPRSAPTARRRRQRTRDRSG